MFPHFFKKSYWWHLNSWKIFGLVGGLKSNIWPRHVMSVFRENKWPIFRVISISVSVKFPYFGCADSHDFVRHYFITFFFFSWSAQCVYTEHITKRGVRGFLSSQKRWLTFCLDLLQAHTDFPPSCGHCTSSTEPNACLPVCVSVRLLAMPAWALVALLVDCRTWSSTLACWYEALIVFKQPS